MLAAFNITLRKFRANNCARKIWMPLTFTCLIFQDFSNRQQNHVLIFSNMYILRILFDLECEKYAVHSVALFCLSVCLQGNGRSHSCISKVVLCYMVVHAQCKSYWNNFLNKRDKKTQRQLFFYYLREERARDKGVVVVLVHELGRPR